MNKFMLISGLLTWVGLLTAQPTWPSVWQWSVEVESVVSAETDTHPEAFLWVPEESTALSGVIFAQNNMVEERLLTHPVFRQHMRELDIAIVWVTPLMSLNFDFHGDDPIHFQELMNHLAAVSGYEELASIPVIPLGHSALASFPWNFAAWKPERTLAVVSIHGDVPLTPLTGSGRPNPDWQQRNIDGVPGLFIMGEYEWWEDRISPAYDFRDTYPLSTLTLFADAGHGHFDCADALVEYISLFLRKAVEYRLPTMTPLDPRKGWLVDRWHADDSLAVPAASYLDFQGDYSTASWVFDQEMALATTRYYAHSQGKKSQYIGVQQQGKQLHPTDAHTGFTPEFIPQEDGISFQVNAYFSDSTKINISNKHAPSTIHIDPITGPVRKLNDTTFQLAFGRLGFRNKKRSNVIWLLAHQEGDENYKRAVQQMELRFPIENKKGKRQRIHFAPIADQEVGVTALNLTASSSLGLPVSYYVKEGPAYVDGQILRIVPLPPRTKYPVRVTVVAWQYGIAGKVRTAWPVERTFFLRKPVDQAVFVRSLKELAHYATTSGRVIRMEPGEYQLADFLTSDSLAQRKARGEFQFIDFSGSQNVFHLEGVSILVDTELRTQLKPPIHTSEFLISGKHNRLSGLHIIYTGSGTSPGGAALEVAGVGNILRDITMEVQGSYPYGYGDLFGKGGPDVIRHQKHSGLLVTGNKTQLYGCQLFMRAFGHGFFVQRRAEDVYFEDCYVEGSVRTTDDILTETTGPAVDVNFRTWTVNREGEYRVTPGYMKSLCEDGFRTYGDMPRISFINCRAKNTRGGFELRQQAGTYLENCTTIGTERAYWVSKDAWVRNCRGDAAFGPLLFLEGSGASVDLTLLPTESDRAVHALATIQGENNELRLQAAGGINRTVAIPIRVAYTHPEHGEGMSPFQQAPAKQLRLINETAMPVIVGDQAEDCLIYTNAEVIQEGGEHIQIIKQQTDATTQN